MIAIGSLFSGIAGLDMGLEMATGGRVIWFCENDKRARRVLAARYPGVHCFHDVGEIHVHTARPDILCGGFPCQPHSLAGKRLGTADPRWLWPEFARAIATVGPSLVFIENVPGLRNSGLRVVLAQLAELGFDAEWGCFSAAHVGAPHRRVRLFILAYARSLRASQSNILGVLRRDGWEARGDDDVANTGGEGLPKRRKQHARDERPPPERGGAEGDAGDVAHAVGDGVREQPGRSGEGGPHPRVAPLDGEAMAHADGRRWESIGWSHLPGIEDASWDVPDRHRGRYHEFPPGPDGIAGWAGPQPAVRRGDDGAPRRVDGGLSRPQRLKLLGNSCVPQQAALAFSVLAKRCGFNFEHQWGGPTMGKEATTP